MPDIVVPVLEDDKPVQHWNTLPLTSPGPAYPKTPDDPRFLEAIKEDVTYHDTQTEYVIAKMPGKTLYRVLYNVTDNLW